MDKMTKENEWQEVICLPHPELDPHGADYGFRRLIINLPQNAKGAYIVRYKLADREELLQTIRKRKSQK